LLSTIQLAITNCRALKIKYHAAYTDAVTDRTIGPLGVYLYKGNGIVAAYCRLRNELCDFRIDRIDHMLSAFVHFADAIDGIAEPKRD